MVEPWVIVMSTSSVVGMACPKRMQGWPPGGAGGGGGGGFGQGGQDGGRVTLDGGAPGGGHFGQWLQ